ncbi:DNA-formamidopyrimidine glycosylase [Aerococcaceae bacterium DSM 111022]|nr:DNA-formamidopyrimidine glycosylase [Aerococcaceae bacterium DSM 111022]
MPELPEVESARVGLDRVARNKQIQAIEVYWPNLISTNLSIDEWQKTLIDQTIHQVSRRGKYLVFELDTHLLVSHLRMEGKYFYFLKEDIPQEKAKHTHVIFKFTDGSQLHYHDVRKFGRFELTSYKDQAAFFNSKKLGPEPTEEAFDLTEFSKALQKKSRAIKTVLLSQEQVVGLGNIYVDEVLFDSGIYPERPANSLTEKEIALLRTNIIQTIERATGLGGSTIRTYKNTLGEAGRYQDYLQVYGKQGTPCPNCGTTIEKIKVHGRGTHYCPVCQPREGNR